MQTIYKYPLSLKDQQVIDLPANADLLDIQMQGDQMCLWAVVDPDASKVAHIVRIEGTGQDQIPFNHRLAPFRRTVQQRGMVWHVFVFPNF